MTFRCRRFNEKRKVDGRVHIGVDAGDVLNESVTCAGEMGQAGFETCEEFRQG